MHWTERPKDLDRALLRSSRFRILALFFLGFGVHVLILAYHLRDPSHFILTFFASNLIIMISGVIVLGLALRIKRSLTLRKQDTPRAG